MSELDTIGEIARELAAVIEPVADAFAAPENFTDFMWDLGWDFATPPSSLQSLGGSAQTLADLFHGEAIEASNIPQVIDTIKAFIIGVNDLGSIADALLPATIDKAAFKAEFPRQLLDTLIVDSLFARHYKWATLLQVFGVIRLEHIAEAGLRPGYLKRSIAWEQLTTLFTGPLDLVTARYNWGQSNFDSEGVILNLAAMFTAWGLPPSTREAPDTLGNFLRANAQPAQTRDVHQYLLRMPFLSDVGPDFDLEAGFALFMLPETAADLPGFSILPYAGGEFALEFGLADGLTLFIEGDADFTAGVGILVRPNKPIQLLKDIVPSATAGNVPPSGAEVGFGIKLGAESEPTIVAGSPDASRLQVGSISVKGGAAVRSDGQHDVFGEIEIAGARIVIQRGPDADGFIAQLLPTDPLNIDFAFGIGISAKHGLYFTDGSSLEIQLPVHIELGPIEILSALIALKPEDRKIPVDLAISLKGNLGPLQAVVENIGLRVTFDFPANRSGNLGTIDAKLGFRPPNGVGLSIDAGVVKGGGYLFIDVDRGEYAGALELTISDFLSLKAIGLITTRMPDGSSGFSLLIIITAEFSPGLQLGYGFALIGVGGLLGLNRTVVLDALALGVRTGAVNGILFPVDPVANAPRIISDLRTIFPPYEGRFLIGPMAKLGWGTPTLISLALGVIIEIPGNIAILGILKLALPTPDAPILQLQVNFIGAIEFDKKRGWFFAALYESRVVFITLEGEMGVLIALGADANFILSVGGFHPRYSPPPLPFPSPKRIAFDVIHTPVALVRAEAYFAVTTNSVQFGARAEAFFGFDEISVEGHLTFDALIRFSPFYFIVEITMGASLKAFGVGVFSIDLQFTFEGPTPWRARGRGSVRLLFVKISANFDETFGESRDTTLPPILVVPLLQVEFENATNWRALPPPFHNLLVSVRPLDLPSDTLVLHPMGALEITQNAIPLGLTLDKVGSQKPADANRFSVSAITAGFVERGETRRRFAPAQFRDFSDAQKLSAPGFQEEVSGLKVGVGGSELRTGHAVKRSVRYEVTTIDTNFRRIRDRFSKMGRGLFDHFVKNAAIAKSGLSIARKKQAQPFDDRIAVTESGYAVVSIDDNRSAVPKTFLSAAEAAEWLRDAERADPNGAAQLHVVPVTEMSEAA